jgi:hypothetical protein
VVIAIVIVAFASMLVQALSKKWAERKGQTPTADGTLSESFAAPDQSMVIHYPADFAAQSVDESTLVLSRNFADGSSEVLHFASISNPISKEAGEFTRIAALAEGRKPLDWEYQEISRAKTKCNGMPGLEILSSWKPPGNRTRSRRWWCAFVRGGRGYFFSYNTPETVAAQHEPLLRSILDATTFSAAPNPGTDARDR